MYIIKTEAFESGARPALQSWNKDVAPEGFALCPDEFYDIFYSTSPAGFVNIEVEDGVVVSMETNQSTLDVYTAEHPAPDPTVEARSVKEAEISTACNTAIVAGMDVETSVGTEHFSLQETDQINLTTAINAIQSGAESYPYHADGSLCRMFTAEEIMAIANAATQHKLYHTTLCNHLLTWVRRAETVEEIESITYSAENLPDDLAENMASIFATAANV